MKKLLLILALSFCSIQAMANVSAKRYRYQTSYSTWERTAYSHYSYSEQYSDCYGLCYDDYSSSQRVYIEETTYSGNSKITSKVVVYEGRSYSRPYATYYVRNGVVVRRSYHRRSHRYYGRDYYHHHYRYHSSVYVSFDSVEGKLLTGLQFVAIGADIMSWCGEEAECAFIGLLASASGLASSISASEQAQRERTELERALEYSSSDEDESLILD